MLKLIACIFLAFYSAFSFSKVRQCRQAVEKIEAGYESLLSAMEKASNSVFVQAAPDFSERYNHLVALGCKTNVRESNMSDLFTAFVKEYQEELKGVLIPGWTVSFDSASSTNITQEQQADAMKSLSERRLPNLSKASTGVIRLTSIINTPQATLKLTRLLDPCVSNRSSIEVVSKVETRNGKGTEKTIESKDQIYELLPIECDPRDTTRKQLRKVLNQYGPELSNISSASVILNLPVSSQSGNSQPSNSQSGNGHSAKPTAETK